MAYSLFSVHGIEIEYAVARKADGRADARVADLLQALGGSPDSHPAFGKVELDNELAAHVVELKTRRPEPALLPVLADFEAAVRGINAALARWDAALLPGGMHPFMDPARDSKLWEHEDDTIYRAYDRIFGCRGHGWFNLQSVHLNLPFNGDAEFRQLHNGISLVLPLLPALAAASPVWDGRAGGWLDSRLLHYTRNQVRVPEIIGPIIPEPVGSEAEYRDRILAPMYRAIAPLDPESILQDEWLNSRAAIARFDRDAIEIRCLDTQENPRADLALCHFTTSLLKHLLAENSDLLAVHRAVPTEALRALFLETARIGGAAALPPEFPVRAFGLEGRFATVGQLLGGLVPLAYGHAEPEEHAVFGPVIASRLREGTLAEKILRRFEANPDPKSLYAWMMGLLDV